MTFTDDMKLCGDCEWFGQWKRGDHTGACFHHTVESEKAPGRYEWAYPRRFCDDAACVDFKPKEGER